MDSVSKGRMGGSESLKMPEVWAPVKGGFSVFLDAQRLALLLLWAGFPKVREARAPQVVPWAPR